MAIYMKVPGAQGNVTVKGYEKWIELKSLDFKLSSDVRMQTGKDLDRHSSLVHLTAIDLLKSIDLSSHSLFEYGCNGKALPEVEIHCCSTGAQITAYAKYKFSNAMVSGYRVNTTHGRPTEYIELSYTKVQTTYQARDANHKLGSPYSAGYNLETAQAM